MLTSLGITVCFIITYNFPPFLEKEGGGGSCIQPQKLLTIYALTWVCKFSILFCYTFPIVLTRRICLRIKSFFSW